MSSWHGGVGLGARKNAESESSAERKERVNNEHGMPIYLEIHKGHRSGHLNFGVMTGLIEEFTLEQMQEFRQMLCVVIGISEDAFRAGNEKRYPSAQNGEVIP